jgi:hypothetical protein
MKHRVRLARTVELGRLKSVQPMAGQFQAWVLARYEQARAFAKFGERLGDGTELDGFRTCSNDKRDT